MDKISSSKADEVPKGDGIREHQSEVKRSFTERFTDADGVEAKRSDQLTNRY